MEKDERYCACGIKLKLEIIDDKKVYKHIDDYLGCPNPQPRIIT